MYEKWRSVGKPLKQGEREKKLVVGITEDLVETPSQLCAQEDFTDPGLCWLKYPRWGRITNGAT